MILIALGHIDSIPAAGWLKRFDEAFPLKVVVVRVWSTQTIKEIFYVRLVGTISIKVKVLQQDERQKA